MDRRYKEPDPQKRILVHLHKSSEHPRARGISMTWLTGWVLLHLQKGGMSTNISVNLTL